MEKLKNKFQFLMVRLKDAQTVKTYMFPAFQFLMVRLKDNVIDYSGDMHPVIPVICTQFGG